MDLRTLSTAGVAKAVKPLRKHGNAEVAAMASKLFNDWKVVAATAGVAGLRGIKYSDLDP